MKETYNDLAIVIVTYKREGLLQVLFDSLAKGAAYPGRVYVVDNDRDPEVGRMCAALEAVLGQGTRPDAAPHVIWIPMDTNTGGSGGFCKGIEAAWRDGAEWIWVMDDDVVLLPGALEKIRPWLDRAVGEDHLVIQPRRLNYDGSIFYWQFHFLYRLGIQNPFGPSGFKKGEAWRTMNAACFEGGVFHRSVIGRIGAPDYRFFIYWDDTIYGYLASKVTHPVLISDILLKRLRHIDNVRIGKVRKLNSTSNTVRYHIMRNRGYMAKYVQLHGEYNALLWGIGTFFAFAKEVIRLFISKEFSSGIKELWRGVRDARKVFKDKDWHPMPRLDP